MQILVTGLNTHSTDFVFREYSFRSITCKFESESVMILQGEVKDVKCTGSPQDLSSFLNDLLAFIFIPCREIHTDTLYFG